MSDETKGMSRRRALECGLWAGAGVLWIVAGGVPRSALIGSAAAAEAAGTDLTFMQISDSHIGCATSRTCHTAISPTSPTCRSAR